jgi:endonuclease III
VNPQRPPRLTAVVSELRALYGTTAVAPLSPFELILLENASYLVTDERRAEVFENLRATIGATPDPLLRAGAERIATAIAGGGMKPMMRAEKVLDCARIAGGIGLDRLNDTVRRADPAARKLLRRFPGIGDPGADRILLLCGGVVSIAPDSNALRVLLRLGYVADQKSYTRTYQLAVQATRAQLPDLETAIAAHVLLRKHGQEICKRSSPRCEVCPLRGGCGWYAEKQ